jgi:DNA-binding HxlR family transcriptional regulator
VGLRGLANEHKNLEENKLIKRTVYDGFPVTIEYTTTDYSKSLKNVIKSLRDWGVNHRKKVIGK